MLIGLLALAVFVTGGGRFSDPLGFIVRMLYNIPGLLVGITIHEYAHAKAAYLLGDPTPKNQGRVTLNPIKHFDLFGLVALLIVGFGWGKPVMISSYYFKNKRRDGFIVAIAGIATNLIAAFLFAGIFVYLDRMLYEAGYQNTAMEILLQCMFGIVYINLALMIFNLLPVPPLDGFNMVTELFNLRKYNFWHTLYNWGFPILILLIMMGVTRSIMSPALSWLWNAFYEMWDMLISAIWEY
jgi:Zn-dependent protease